MAIKPIIILLVGLTLASVHPAEAQQPKKVPLIGYLSNTDPAGESTRSEAIRVAVQERGYREGQNIATESRCAEGRGKK
jgi:putative tryptophan/tyrosine transport system substrate-binding protein